MEVAKIERNKKIKKIAIFTDTYLPQINGVTNTISRFTKYLEQEGIEYMIFAPDTFHLKDKSIHVERFFSLRFLLYPECRLSIPNYFRAMQIVKDFEPDVIQLFTEFNIGVLGKRIGKKLGIQTFTNYSTNFSTYLKYYHIQFLENLSWKYMNWFHDEGITTFCPSKETKKQLESKGIKNIKVFSRGIDCDKFTPDFGDKYITDNNKINLLYVGRVAPEKDLEILFKAYNKIVEEIGDKVHLNIVGEGPSLNYFKSKYTKNISYLGYKMGNDLAQIYANSQMFVFPSSTETLGNVVLEAMASGVPVVGAYAGGVKDNLINMHNGISCRSKNIEDFVEGIRVLVKDNSLRNKLAENARKYAETKTWKMVFEQLLNNYYVDIEEKNWINKIA